MKRSKEKNAFMLQPIKETRNTLRHQSTSKYNVTQPSIDILHYFVNNCPIFMRFVVFYFFYNGDNSIHSMK